MAISKIDICNMALARITEKTLVSFDDHSKAKELCVRFYSQASDEALYDCRPNCAKGRQELAASTTAPAFGYKYQYKLPVDCLRVIETELDEDYEIEDGHLVTDAESCKILFIKRLTDPSGFDPKLIEVVLFGLAAKIVVPLTGKQKFASVFDQERERKLAEAKSLNSRQNRARSKNRRRVENKSEWAQSRV